MTTTETETPDLPAEAGAPALEPAAKVSFWDRPNVERYFTPLFLPLVVVFGLVMFVINISRIFLAGHGHSAVIIGSLITATIILGAAMLSAAPNLRSSSIALVTAGFVGSVLMAGWLSVGSAAFKEEGGEALPPEGPSVAALDFNTAGLQFVPDAADSTTGIVGVTLTSSSGQHTLHFEDPATSMPTIETPGTGDTGTARAFFGEAGEYVFYCTIPGHRSSGMEGTVTVEGDPVTIEEAIAAAEAAGGGEGGEVPPDDGEGEVPTGEG